MKTRLFVCLLALFALLAASCGSDPAETSVAASSSDAPANSAPSDDAMEDDTMDDDTMEDDAMSEDDAMEDDAMSEDDAMEDDAMEDDAMEDGAMEDDAMAEDGAMSDEDAIAEDDAMADDASADGLQRIISLSPSSTEMLFAIGAGDQVVAVDDFSNYPPEAPTTDLSGFAPNLEAIAGFEPDLVVTSAPLEGLSDLGIENLVAPAATNLDDIYAQIETLGAVTGNVGEAAELVLQMQTDIDNVLSTLPDQASGLTFYHELDNTLYSVTSNTFVGYVYDLFGMVNVADPADPDGEAFGYPQLNEEFLITADPDLIFLADTLCCEQTAETVAARPAWDQLTAVQNGNVIELNDDIVSRWGPRIVDFIEAIGVAVNELELEPAS